MEEETNKNELNYPVFYKYHSQQVNSNCNLTM